MKIQDREEVKAIREKYPEGTKVRLIRMDDVQAPPEGTIGTVTYVDDAGTIHMKWENGSSLGLIEEEDRFEKIGEIYEVRYISGNSLKYKITRVEASSDEEAVEKVFREEGENFENRLVSVKKGE